MESYRRHLHVIQPKLPESARDFARYGFHDAEVCETHFGKKELSFLLNLRGCFSEMPQPCARVSFHGVREYSRDLPRVGECWLYDELHLDGESGFSLHVFFERTDFHIAADEVDLQFLPQLSMSR